MVEFLINTASKLDLLDDIINGKDELGLTPIYMLCQQGYLIKGLKDGSKPDHPERKDIISMLINGTTSGDAKDVKPENKAEWIKTCPQIKYSCMHWLCFWDDAESIKYLLDIVASQGIVD